jgi:N-methylhydantoinase A
VLTPLEADRVEALLPILKASQAEAVAVCLLFSFINPEHERMIASRLREAGYAVSVSSEIVPEYRNEAWRYGHQCLCLAGARRYLHPWMISYSILI